MLNTAGQSVPFGSRKDAGHVGLFVTGVLCPQVPRKAQLIPADSTDQRQTEREPTRRPRGRPGMGVCEPGRRRGPAGRDPRVGAVSPKGPTGCGWSPESGSPTLSWGGGSGFSLQAESGDIGAGGRDDENADEERGKMDRREMDRGEMEREHRGMGTGLTASAEGSVQRGCKNTRDLEKSPPVWAPPGCPCHSAPPWRGATSATSAVRRHIHQLLLQLDLDSLRVANPRPACFLGDV